MAQYTPMQLTQLGQNALANAQNGTEMQFTKIKVGDGTATDIPALTDLVKTIATLQLESASVQNGIAKISSLLSNAGFSTGFYLREIGIFATQNGQEFLYAYTKATTADFIPPEGSGPVTQQLNFQLTVQSGSNITFQVPNSAVALRTEMNSLETVLRNELRDVKGLVTQTAHSGVLDYESTVGASMNSTTGNYGQVQVPSASQYSTALNKIALRGFAVLVAGARTIVDKIGYAGSNPMYNEFTLPSPPTTGERLDMVFWEQWRDKDTQEWKGRFRAVEGVDFDTYPEGFSNLLPGSNARSNGSVQPQGGNASPLALDYVWSSSNNYWKYAAFHAANYRASGTAASGLFPTDVGLYIAGDGSTAAKAALQTYDGYIYAIPLFRVRRRNNGGYSIANPFGARDYVALSPIVWASFNTGDTKVFTVTSTTGLKVGDVLSNAGFPNLFTVQSIESTTSLTLRANQQYSGAGSWSSLTLPSDRPDGLFANIVAERDITDMRHKTNLKGWNTRQMMEYNADKLLKSELQTSHKKRMLKTYHGIRKTPIDANHVFYASLDSTLTAEVGGALTIIGATSQGYVPSPTGSAPTFNEDRSFSKTLSGVTASEGTVDFLAEISNYMAATIFGYQGLLELRDSAGYPLTHILLQNNGAIYVGLSLSQGSNGLTAADKNVFTALPNYKSGLCWTHFRIAWGSGTITFYLNGLPIKTITGTLRDIPTEILIGGVHYTGNTNTLKVAAGIAYMSKMPIADVSVSNINRGSTFATLPTDFILGHARIMPALNNQRKILSDAQASQPVTQLVKVQSAPQERGITVTKGTGVNTNAWEAGDKIKVRGLAGGIITGVIDSDTALARVLNIAGTAVTVDDVSKLTVNDMISFIKNDGTTSTKTITAIDTTTKIITINSALSGQDSGWYPSFAYENTTSTSNPVVKTVIDNVVTTVTGTWANLGTNEAEFTFGTLPAGLDVEDIQIEYSLNTPAGQAGTPEVYSATLAGEAKGQKLKVGATFLTDDFIGKVAGSVAVNPHVMKVATASGLQAPSAFVTEATQAQYDAAKTPGDNSLFTLSTSVNGQQAQALVQKDIIALATAKYPGFFRGCLILADKIQRLKDKLSRVVINAWVSGSGPAGNKVTVAVSDNNVWVAFSSNTGTSVAKIAGTSNSLNTKIDANGLMSFLIYADPSDGVIPSIINVEAVNIELDLVSKTGYDLLVPENPRRDTGVANCLYVRKETKEIESLVHTDEQGGLVTWGDFVPYQGIAARNTTKVLNVVAVADKIFIHTYGTGKTPGTTDVGSAGKYYANPISPQLPQQTDKSDYDLVLDAATGFYSTIGTLYANAYIDAFIVGDQAYFETAVKLKPGKTVSITASNLTSRGGGYANTAVLMRVDKLPSGMYQYVYYALVEDNGELFLLVITTIGAASSVANFISGSAAAEYYRLEGRPLIKGWN